MKGPQNFCEPNNARFAHSYPANQKVRDLRIPKAESQLVNQKKIPAILAFQTPNLNT